MIKILSKRPSPLKEGTIIDVQIVIDWFNDEKHYYAQLKLRDHVDVTYLNGGYISMINITEGDRYNGDKQLFFFDQGFDFNKLPVGLVNMIVGQTYMELDIEDPDVIEWDPEYSLIERVKDNYTDGVCPECHTEIPDDFDCEGSCSGCGHVLISESLAAVTISYDTDSEN